MRKHVFAAAAVVAAASAPVGVAGADPGSGSAADTVASLKSEGYQVQLNISGNSSLPLSSCTVAGIHPSNLNSAASSEEKGHTLVTVDVSCPSH